MLTKALRTIMASRVMNTVFSRRLLPISDVVENTVLTCEDYIYEISGTISPNLNGQRLIYAGMTVLGIHVWSTTGEEDPSTGARVELWPYNSIILSDASESVLVPDPFGGFTRIGSGNNWVSPISFEGCHDLSDPTIVFSIAQGDASGTPILTRVN